MLALFALPATAQDTLGPAKSPEPPILTEERSAVLDEAAARWIPNTGRPIEDLAAARLQLMQEMNAAQDAVKGDGFTARLKAMTEWYGKNAARVAAVGRAAEHVAATLPALEAKIITAVQIPNDASPDLEEFLVERARMHNEGIRIRQRLDADPAQAAAILEKWRADEAASAEKQRLHTAAVHAQMADWVPDVPLHPQIPLDASPALTEFLTDRHAILRERTEAQRQAEKTAPGTKEKAAAQWDAANKARLDRLAEKAALLPEH